MTANSLNNIINNIINTKNFNNLKMSQEMSSFYNGDVASPTSVPRITRRF